MNFRDAVNSWMVCPGFVPRRKSSTISITLAENWQKLIYYFFKIIEHIKGWNMFYGVKTHYGHLTWAKGMGRTTVCSTVCSQANNKENINAPLYSPVVREIHWWQVIFPHIIYQDCMTILWNRQDTRFLIVYAWFYTVLKIKASPTVRDWQLFRRTDNFFRISLSFHV